MFRCNLFGAFIGLRMKNLAAVMCKIKNEGATFPEVSNSNMVLGCFFLFLYIRCHEQSAFVIRDPWWLYNDRLVNVACKSVWGTENRDGRAASDSCSEKSFGDLVWLLDLHAASSMYVLHVIVSVFPSTHTLVLLLFWNANNPAVWWHGCRLKMGWNGPAPCDHSGRNTPKTLHWYCSRGYFSCVRETFSFTQTQPTAFNTAKI